MKNIDFFRDSIQKEKLIKLDFKYLSNDIETWWKNLNPDMPLRLAKFQLANLILKNAAPNDIAYFDQLGLNNISAVTISNIFFTDCHKLARIVHEAISELFALNDIKYPYEEHKNIYLKPGGENYRDWGNGFGEITPHSDDLYEDLNTDFLSLTVCRDTTHTPTEIYFPKDILSDFTDVEISRLLNLKVKFISGKNISILKSRERNIIEYCPISEFKFYLDFRIDTEVGERMIPINSRDRDLIEKMRINIESCTRQKSDSRTGTFTIIANFKALHARAQMKIDRSTAIEIANNKDYSFAPRLLFRNKGQDARFLNV
ncbi:MAG: hypothetical protein A3E85_05095 [Gammaproteobacteria bacterium RIFCSPHIGHO2_12_FULL_45_12]|nr:MAG: hypothetical protein A3E85_05095 [Gammaproteobacteria bacterium RIFCSPHIGHO2_12_FULL_45_12]